MALIEIDRNPPRGTLRWFGLLWLPLALAMLAWLARSRLGAPVAWTWTAAGVLAAASILVGALAPSRLRPVFVGWMLAVSPIGWTIGHVLLGLIYFGLVTPIGLARRLLAGDPLRRRFDRQAATYWQPRPPSPPASSYFRPY